MKLGDKEVRDKLVEWMRKELGIKPRFNYWFVEIVGGEYSAIVQY